MVNKKVSKLVNSFMKKTTDNLDLSEEQVKKLQNNLIDTLHYIFSNNDLLNNCINNFSLQEGTTMQFDEILQWWQGLHIQTGEDLCLALDNFKIIFACNSNGIEGNNINYHTTREIFNGEQISNFSGSVREIFETQNQKFAFDYIVKSFDSKHSIDKQMIQKLHRILMYGCYDNIRWNKGERPGEFKKGDYCVGLDDVGSFPEDVEDDLQELINELNINESENDILVKAAFLHVTFEIIHPFADGNGRVGRTLMNYYLILHNYPPIIIYNEDKETYYLALEVFNKTGKLSGFIKFLQEQAVKTWSNKIVSNNSNKVKKLSLFLRKEGD